MSLLKKLFLVLITCLFMFGLSGCPDQEGPAERTGEKMDEAVEDAGEEMEEAGDKIEDSVDK